MRNFSDCRLSLLTAVCVAALTAHSVEAAKQDEASPDKRTPTKTGSDSGAGSPELPTGGQSDTDAEPGAPALLAPITTEAIEANANVDLPQDI